MASETSGNVRTLIGYASDLLKYPRLVIERDVDFTHCQHDGRHNAFLADCVDCQFGVACNWLNIHRTPDVDGATLDELVEAIDSACGYMQAKIRQKGRNDAEMLAWLREARRFLHARGL
ncbi:MAG: hypothetical protein ACR2Q3_02730 [Woeseiaceae bacterium]